VTPNRSPFSDKDLSVKNKKYLQKIRMPIIEHPKSILAQILI
jgi:hypothetical protein